MSAFSRPGNRFHVPSLSKLTAVISCRISQRPYRSFCSMAGYITAQQIPPWDMSVEGKFSQSKPSPSGLGMRVILWHGDITKLKVDAIANAANPLLQGRGGVDGAIHRGAGPQLRPTCRSLGGCAVGSAKMTSGFKLPSKYIIHCVGPIGQKPDLLRSTYQTALEMCTEHGLKTIAFPCISTGVYRYPQRPAAEVAIPTVLSYLATHADIERVIFCVFLREDLEIYKELLPKMLQGFDSTSH